MSATPWQPNGPHLSSRRAPVSLPAVRHFAECILLPVPSPRRLPHSIGRNRPVLPVIFVQKLPVAPAGLPPEKAENRAGMVPEIPDALPSLPLRVSGRTGKESMHAMILDVTDPLFRPRGLSCCERPSAGCVKFRSESWVHRGGHIAAMTARSALEKARRFSSSCVAQRHSRADGERCRPAFRVQRNANSVIRKCV